MSRQAIFVIAILASSFLIFLVQPMVGKRILPWFGGTAGVWALCLAFYQTTLFLGYAYAHLLIRFARPRMQLGIHGLLAIFALIALPVLPGEAWKPNDVAHPSLDILMMLGSSVSLPFIALASTGPLVQAWFARSDPDRSPYPLYAVSNLGSFAALLSYPFLIEPRLALSTTGTLWTYAFVATLIAVLACAFLAQRDAPPTNARLDRKGQTETGTVGGSEHASATSITMWILLPACAVVVLMGVTNSVCLDVASVPFLWILPLATYLLTFVLCFASESLYRFWPCALLALGGSLLTLGQNLVLLLASPLVDAANGSSFGVQLASLTVQIPAYCALLFGICTILHGELYRLRPPANALTVFYLCISGGGALGGLFVGILAPMLLDDYYEVRIGIGLAMLLVLGARALAAQSSTDPPLGETRRRVAVAIGCAVGFYALWPPEIDRDVVIHQERGFFGVLRVEEYGTGESRQRHFVHGATLHGVEFAMREKGRPIASSYYGRATAIAAALMKRTDGESIHVGIVGLGVGTLAYYGRSGDRFRYYELDPAVEAIAQGSGYFSFLERSLASIEVVLGDARLSIENEQRQLGSQEFDFLIIDAFSSDAIPVHLLTLEAFQLYESALAEHGILAIHTTNRFFDLSRLVARAGFEVGLETLQVHSAPAPQYQSKASQWILLSRESERLRELRDSLKSRSATLGLPPNHLRLRRPRRSDLHDVLVWSDDYSDLLSAARF